MFKLGRARNVLCSYIKRFKELEKLEGKEN